MHFIGPLLPDPPSHPVLPEWWSELHCGRKVVLVTQGTVRNEDTALIGPTLDALAGSELLVVATAASHQLPGPVPENVRTADYLPFSLLMPHVDICVTNGGYGTVQMALAHGVPLVVAGATEDKPEVAARVSWTGSGIRIPDQQPTAASIRDAINRLLTDSTYRGNAERIAADMARYDAAGLGAELLEQLADTRRPVLRGQHICRQATPPAQASRAHR